MTEAGTPARRLARSARSLAVLNIISMGIAFLIGVLLARQLGPSAYGVYGLAMTVVTLAGMVTEFGLPTLVMREVAVARANERWDIARGLLIFSNRIVLGLSAAVITAFFIFVLVTGPSAHSAFVATLIWAIMLIPIVAASKIKGLALLSLGHNVAGQLPVLLMRPGLFALALAGLWIMGHSISAPLAMALQTGAAFVAMVAVVTAWIKLRPAAMYEAAPKFAPHSWISACLPMGMTEGLRLLQGQASILLLGLLATTHDVGIYRVGDSVALVTVVGHSVLLMAMGPLAANLHAKGDREGLARVVSATAAGMLLTTFLLGLPFLLAGRQLFALGFGAEFAPSVVPFLLIWGAFLVSAAFGPTQVYANMTGKPMVTMISFVIAVTVGASIGAAAIPWLGVSGAGLGVLCGSLCSNLWIWHTIKSRDGVDTSVFAPGARSFFAPKRIISILRH